MANTSTETMQLHDSATPGEVSKMDDLSYKIIQEW